MKQDSQKEMRKQMFDRMEAELQKTCKPEERMFALHTDEDHIIVLDNEQAFSDQITKFERSLPVAQAGGRDADGLPDRV